MISWFDIRPTPSDVVLRAFAIGAVTYHHAHLTSVGPMGLAGGMTFLFMLSGMNFARFAIQGSSPVEVRRAIFELGRQVFVPSILLIVLSFAVMGQFNLLELLFLRNLFEPKRISVFYVWYPQVLLQLLAALYLLLSIPAAAKQLQDHPARTLLSLFAVGLVLRAFGPVVWNTTPLRDHVPHMFLWNFALGGVVYYLAVDETRSRPYGKWLAVACVIAAAFVAWDVRRLTFWWLAVGGVFIVCVRQIWLPRLVARPIMLVSVATFGIFLTHPFWIKAGTRLYRLGTGTTAEPAGIAVFLFALLMGTLTWAAVHALFRTLRTLQLEPQRRAAAQ